MQEGITGPGPPTTVIFPSVVVREKVFHLVYSYTFSHTDPMHACIYCTLTVCVCGVTVLCILTFWPFSCKHLNCLLCTRVKAIDFLPLHFSLDRCLSRTMHVNTLLKIREQTLLMSFCTPGFTRKKKRKKDSNCCLTHTTSSSAEHVLQCFFSVKVQHQL